MNSAVILSRAAGLLLVLVRLLHHAGVIVNNAPALRKTLPHQGENSSDITARASKMPMPQHQGRIVAKKMKFEARKIELAHRRAVGIIFLVPGEHAIPPARNPAAPGKCQIRRTPIPFQECVHIALVPIILLSLKNFCYGRTVALVFVGGSAQFRSPQGPDNECHEKHCQRADSAKAHDPSMSM